MNHKIIILPLLLVFMLPAMVRAESSPMYIGINTATFDLENSNTDHDGGMLNLGFDLNNYFAVELAGGASKTNEDQATSTSSKINYAASAFVRFNLRFNHITIYALGGYSRVKTSSTSTTTSTTTEENGGSYGYGIDFYGARDLALSVRRVELIDADGAAGSPRVRRGATMLGITYYFDKPKIYSRY